MKMILQQVCAKIKSAWRRIPKKLAITFVCAKGIGGKIGLVPQPDSIPPDTTERTFETPTRFCSSRLEMAGFHFQERLLLF
jgi:hypothetical protein